MFQKIIELYRKNKKISLGNGNYYNLFQKIFKFNLEKEKLPFSFYYIMLQSNISLSAPLS